MQERGPQKEGTAAQSTLTLQVGGWSCSFRRYYVNMPNSSRLLPK